VKDTEVTYLNLTKICREK